jgi:hypothetical protein
VNAWVESLQSNSACLETPRPGSLAAEVSGPELQAVIAATDATSTLSDLDLIDYLLREGLKQVIQSQQQVIRQQPVHYRSCGSPPTRCSARRA